MSRWRLDWPTAGGQRPGEAIIRSSPADFFVDEILGTTLQGAGEHLCVRLEKTGDNTRYVAGGLARLAGCRVRDVGYCGLKDRHAVTRQWFSVPCPVKSDPRALVEAIQSEWSVLDHQRHDRKLRPGSHSSNRFVIRLQQVAGDVSAIEQALTSVRDKGVPNYFGPQRFGHQGGNLDRAVEERGRRPSKGGLYLSAARAWLFNEVLAERVGLGNWTRRLNGEPDPETATGPLWGDGGTGASDEQGQLEREVVQRAPLIASVFDTSRMAPERRPLRLLPRDFRWQWNGPASLELSFVLPTGAFATAVLTEAFCVRDGSPSSEQA